MSRFACDRRHVVLAGLSALATLPAIEAVALPRVGREGLAARAAGLFSDRAKASALGRSYLAQHPDEADAGRLLDALFADMPPAQAAGEEGDVEAIRAWLATCIEDDFRRAQVTPVDGWILARSEARLCALASLA